MWRTIDFQRRSVYNEVSSTNKVKIVYPLNVHITVRIKSTLSQRVAVQAVPLIL